MKKICFILLLILLGTDLQAREIPLKKMGGVFHVPVEINQTITLDFIIDTGAAEVTIPADVALTLMRSGTISKEDMLPEKEYTLADGNRVTSQRVLLKTLKVGSQTLENVPASITEVEGPLLLGQSCLERLGSFSIDAQSQTLKFDEKYVLVKASPPVEELQEARSVLRRKIDSSTPEGAVEVFLRSIADQRFEISWYSLSRYSKKKIVERVVAEEKGEYSIEEIRNLFDKNDDSIRQGFWSSYRESSKIPEIVMLATYHPLESKKGEATVKVRVGRNEVEFKTYREEETWKVGLVESLENQPTDVDVDSE